MENDSITIKAVPVKLIFTEIENKVWRSQYSFNGYYFYIKAMYYGYLLEVPIAFLKQFEKHKTQYMMKAESYEEGEKILQLIYRGQARPIENEIVFFSVS